MSEAPVAQRPVSAERIHPGGLDLLVVPPRARTGWRVLPARVGAMCAVELQKLRHDRTELYTRAVQPALWLLIFGETFTRIKAIPTGGIPYLDYLAPGIIAQSAMFIAIFYGIMIIWEREAGILTKLLVTPTPRSALITGKAFAAGVKALIQAVVVVVIAALLGVAMTWNPLRLLGVAVAVVLGSAFFSCLSMTIAGIVLTRDRLMGIGQAIATSSRAAARYSTDRAIRRLTGTGASRKSAFSPSRINSALLSSSPATRHAPTLTGVAPADVNSSSEPRAAPTTMPVPAPLVARDQPAHAYG
ncbi:ABC transporter permease [Streptomyces sp. NPDC058086]|uniref:ABC transporter permease n=1 Tax=Streptomyces sp. NPDC058086 TaxID=3346334 RepID=UPI0036E9F17A